jgi:hypothetical protein
MTSSLKKQELRNNLINIYNNKENYNLISLYRQLLVYNNIIQIYVSTEIYNAYITELYSIVDTYLYNDDFNQDDINIFLDNINKIINYL